MREPKDWQRNRLGPYTLLRRLRGVSTAEDVGRVYAARHRPSGRPALVVTPASPGHEVPAADYLLRMRSSASPANAGPYVALEVEGAPAGEQPLAEVERGVGTIWLALRGVEQHPEVIAHLAGGAQVVRSGRRAVRVQAWVALAAAVLLAVLCLPRLWSAGAVQQAAAPVQEARISAAEEALVEPEALPVGSMEGRPTLALDMPKGPFPGQYRVDKQGKCKGRREVPINGGCWIALKGEAPCGDDAYEHKGTCYWPSMPAAKEPSSTLPRPPPMPARGTVP